VTDSKACYGQGKVNLRSRRKKATQMKKFLDLIHRRGAGGVCRR
jgi:hypothetical protein